MAAGVWPALWQPPAGAASGSRQRSGLQTLEHRWQLSHAAALAQPPSRRRPAADFEVPLLPCQQPGKRPWLGVFERLARQETTLSEAVESLTSAVFFFFGFDWAFTLAWAANATSAVEHLRT